MRRDDTFSQRNKAKKSARKESWHSLKKDVTNIRGLHKIGGRNLPTMICKSKTNKIYQNQLVDFLRFLFTKDI